MCSNSGSSNKPAITLDQRKGLGVPALRGDNESGPLADRFAIPLSKFRIPGITRRNAMVLNPIFLSCLLSVPWNISLEKVAPLLPIKQGSVQKVKDTASLKQVLESGIENATVLVADGIYDIAEPIYIQRGRNIVLRGASNDPTKTVLRGRGFFEGKPDDDLLRIGKVENVTIAYLTFTECRSYGIKVEAENFPKDVHIYSCHFKNIGTRMIKGSTSQQGMAVGGSIRYCRFENTKIPPHEWLFEGDYITAIDMMALDGWQISDNFFKDIKGRNGGARGAVFIWVRSRNVTVERNAIVNCDRGISFGNPSGSSNYVPGQEHIRNSIIRNNFIVPGPDAGIELWWADHIKVYNNTIWRDDAEGPGLRGGADEWKITHVDVVNNLVRGTNMLAGGVRLRSNLFFSDFPIDALDPHRTNLRLAPFSEKVVNKGTPLQEVVDDFEGRPRKATPDIGAVETMEGRSQIETNP